MSLGKQLLGLSLSILLLTNISWSEEQVCGIQSFTEQQLKAFVQEQIRLIGNFNPENIASRFETAQGKMEKAAAESFGSGFAAYQIDLTKRKKVEQTFTVDPEEIVLDLSGEVAEVIVPGVRTQKGPDFPSSVEAIFYRLKLRANCESEANPQIQIASLEMATGTPTKLARRRRIAPPTENASSMGTSEQYGDLIQAFKNDIDSTKAEVGFLLRKLESLEKENKELKERLERLEGKSR